MPQDCKYDDTQTYDFLEPFPVVSRIPDTSTFDVDFASKALPADNQTLTAPHSEAQEDLQDLNDHELQSLSACATVSMDSALDVLTTSSHDTGRDNTTEGVTATQDTDKVDDTMLRHGSLTTVYANPLSARRSSIPAAKPRRELFLLSSMNFVRANEQLLQGGLSLRVTANTGLSSW